MSVRVKPVRLAPQDLLMELARDALPSIAGADCEVIADKLPYDGSLILARDAEHRPVLVSCDARDGGRALLAGLAAVTGLTENRALFFLLYPGLFRHRTDTSAAAHTGDLRLALLAPAPPPGGAFLERAFPLLSVFTFRILQIGDELGMLVEPHALAAEYRRAPPPATVSPFRAGTAALSRDEEAFFQEL